MTPSIAIGTACLVRFAFIISDQIIFLFHFIQVNVIPNVIFICSRHTLDETQIITENIAESFISKWIPNCQIHTVILDINICNFVNDILCF